MDNAFSEPGFAADFFECQFDCSDAEQKKNAPEKAVAPPVTSAQRFHTGQKSILFNDTSILISDQLINPKSTQHLRKWAAISSMDGFPIEQVLAISNRAGDISAKAAALKSLQPVAFVEDYLPYLRGLPAQIYAALILREPNWQAVRCVGLKAQ